MTTTLQTEFERLERSGEKELEFLETTDALGKVTRLLAAVFILSSSFIFLQSSPSTGGRLILSTPFFITLLALSVINRVFLGDYFNKKRTIPRVAAYGILAVIALTFIPLSLHPRFGVEQRLVVISNLLIAINAVNFLTRMRYSEYRGLFVSSVFLMATSIFLDPGVSLLARVPVFVLTGAAALGSLTLLLERARFNERETGGRRSGCVCDTTPTTSGSSRTVWLLVALALGTMAAGALVFFLFPRLNVPSPLKNRQIGGRGGRGMIGGGSIDSTPEVSFDAYSNLAEDDTVIFTVGVYDAERLGAGERFIGSFRLRATALSTYTPTVTLWRNDSTLVVDDDVLDYDYLNDSRLYQFRGPGQRLATNESKTTARLMKIKPTVNFSPPSEAWGLPVSGVADSLFIDNTLHLDDQRNIMLFGLPRCQAVYRDKSVFQIRSRKHTAAVEALRLSRAEVDFRLPNGGERDYLNWYGPEIISDEAFALYRRWTATAQTDYDRVRAVEYQLSSSMNYSYDLNIKRNYDFGAKAAVNTLLLKTRSGHCGLYATAMTLLLRRAGIPARVVSGYHVDPGAWNPVEKVYAVRRLDAHAWVEVYFAGIGWLPFEPTPGNYNSDDPRGTEDSDRKADGLKPLPPDKAIDPDSPPDEPPESIRPDDIKKHYWDYNKSDMDIWWDQNVLRYDRQAQQRLYGGLRQRLRDMFATGDSVHLPLNIGLGWWLLAIAVILSAVLFASRYRRRLEKERLKRGGTGRETPQLAFYYRLLKFMRRLGYERRQWETPSAFASRVTAAGQRHSMLATELTDHFEKDVYGGQTLTDGELAALERKLDAAAADEESQQTNQHQPSKREKKKTNH